MVSVLQQRVVAHNVAGVNRQGGQTNNEIGRGRKTK